MMPRLNNSGILRSQVEQSINQQKYGIYRPMTDYQGLSLEGKQVSLTSN